MATIEKSGLFQLSQNRNLYAGHNAIVNIPQKSRIILTEQGILCFSTTLNLV